jgi:hypothetical protein
MDRRKFIKVFGILSLGITFLPQFLTKKTFNKISFPRNTNANRFWLWGIPKRGCATSYLLSEQGNSFESCLHDIHNLCDLS